LSNTVIVAADVGEAKDAGRFAKRLELPLALIDKRRYGDDENAKPAHVIGDIAGKDCLLVDDEIATGGTLFNATEFLLERGARSVSAAVVHPVLSGKAPEKLKTSRLQRLLVTNTLPIPSQATSPKLEVLSLAPQLATAILHIHDGSSVSALFS
jgi:ribose-phosphate pyrophosphokinase